MHINIINVDINPVRLVKIQQSGEGYSCPRDCRFLAPGVQLSAPQNPSNITALWIEGFNGRPQLVPYYAESQDPHVHTR